MRKFLSFLLLGLLLSVGNAWATDETLTISSYATANSWGNGTQYLTATVGNVTFTATGTSNSGKYYSVDNTWRFYANESAKLTISVPSGSTISSVTPTFTVKDNGVLYYNSSACTSAQAIAVNSNSVEFIIGQSSGNKGKVFISQVAVTYSNGGTPSPTISASNVNIDYDATEGSIPYSVSNPVEGGAISAAITAGNEGAWLTLGQGTTSPIAFTCSANEGSARTATVTLTYTYNTNETVTKDVTITQAAAPVVYSTIADVFAAATNSETPVLVTFNNWIVSGVSTNGKNIFVTDGTNGLIIYYTSDMSSTFAAGKILSGTAVSCNLKLYNGAAELLNLDANDLMISDGGVISPANVEMANLSGINTGALVSYNNLTCSIDNSKYYLSDGTTTLQVYNSLFAFGALVAGKKYNITGVYQQYNSTKEILPRSAADIVEAVIPNVHVEETTINVAAAGDDGIINVTYENLTIADASDFDIQYYDGDDNEISAPNWLLCVVEGTNTYHLSYTIDANTGAARTAYLKVYALDNEANAVYSERITISQGEYIDPTAFDNYVLVTDVADIVPGAHYIFASGKNGAVKIMAEQKSTNRAAQGVTAADGVIDIPKSSKAHEFVICKDGNLFAIYEEEVGYLYAASSSSNQLKSQQINNVNGQWSISIGSGNIVSIVATGSSNRNVMRYNSSGDGLFNCYASATQSDVYLYRKTGETFTTETVVVSEVGYATLYYGEKNLIVPEGVVARAYKAEGAALVETETYEAGEVIPKTIAVVLEGAEGNYDFVVTSVPGLGPAATNLNGTDTQEDITPDDNYYFYALSLANGSTDHATVGFYWMNNTGAAFENGAHKAYLMLPKSQFQNNAPSRILFNEENATNIQNVEGSENAVKFIENGQLYILKNGVVYDAMGTIVR